MKGTKKERKRNLLEILYLYYRQSFLVIYVQKKKPSRCDNKFFYKIADLFDDYCVTTSRNDE